MKLQKMTNEGKTKEINQSLRSHIVKEKKLQAFSEYFISIRFPHFVACGICH